MKKYLHRVVGLYATRPEAQSVLDRLIKLGQPSDTASILLPGSKGWETRADDDDVLKEVLREGAIGTAVGTAAGAAGTAALAAANISLFIANPILGTLAMLGWGASVGGIVGAAAGAQSSKGSVSDLIRDALAGGHVVLVVHASTETQTSMVRKIIGESMHESVISV